MTWRSVAQAPKPRLLARRARPRGRRGRPRRDRVLVDQAALQQVRERHVERLHADALAGLHHRRDLVQLVLADQVPDRRRADQELAGRDRLGRFGRLLLRACRTVFLRSVFAGCLGLGGGCCVHLARLRSEVGTASGVLGLAASATASGLSGPRRAATKDSAARTIASTASPIAGVAVAGGGQQLLGALRARWTMTSACARAHSSVCSTSARAAFVSSVAWCRDCSRSRAPADSASRSSCADVAVRLREDLAGLVAGGVQISTRWRSVSWRMRAISASCC